MFTNLTVGGTGGAPVMVPKLTAKAKTPRTNRFPVGATCPPRHTVMPSPNIAVTLTKAEMDATLTEIAQREAELPLFTIVRSRISLYSWEEMQRVAPVRITNKTFEGPGSVNDPRMGVPSSSQPCQQCFQIDCPGHFGLIEFGTPIYNPTVIREIISVLTCVCNDCGGLLLNEDMIRQLKFNRMPPEKRLKAMEAHCKDIDCSKKKATQGQNQGPLIPCASNPEFVTVDIKEKGEIMYKVPQRGNKKATKDDPVYVMPIATVMSILDMISDADAALMGFPSGSHPRNMVMRGILVPPPIARPPIYEGGSVHHDQLTHMFTTIRRKVDDILAPTLKKDGDKDPSKELYNAVRQLIFKTEGKKLGIRDYLSLVERIQGKSALLRALLMGKRVDYCGRTVAGPDSSLRFGQIRIPAAWAPVLVKKVTVTDYNIHNLTALLESGKITHITSKKTGLRKFYNPSKRYRLQTGDVVDRWLRNGDRIVVNRQPTLHRQSIMAYEVVLGHELTIGLHLSYTSPMNCDFDGDENNAWDPLDFEVEAEAEIIMNVKHNVMSAEQNRPIMGLVMNSITGAYLLTQDNTRLHPDLFAELLTMITNQDDLITLRQRLEKYGVHPLSGAAMFSALLPADFDYSNKGVDIREGVLINGRIKKSHVGSSHRSIIQELWKNYDAQRTADFFSDAPWIIGKWLIERGFSVGLLDMISLAMDEDGREYDKNKRILEQELAKIYVQLEALGGKVDDKLEEEHRQRQINNLVNIAEGIGLRLARETLSGDNSIGVMSDQGAGTKGGIANIGQMMGSVGQQFYRGERLAPTLSGGRRLLPTYDYDSNDPEAHAFIPQSFFTGLTPEGLFFLQAGGREGLLDTALKTADTGSMQHRMIKALENIIVGYDGSIRNTIGIMFSPIYNAGYDIAEMVAVENKEKPDFSSFMDIKSAVAKINADRGWVTKATNDLVQKKRAQLAEEPAGPNVLLESDPQYGLGPRVVPNPEPYNTNVLPNWVPSEQKITKFEKSRIIGTRARQIANNAPPLVDIGTEMDPVKIALMEYEQGILPLYVIRRHADNSYDIVHPTLDNI